MHNDRTFVRNHRSRGLARRRQVALTRARFEAARAGNGDADRAVRAVERLVGRRIPDRVLVPIWRARSSDTVPISIEARGIVRDPARGSRADPARGALPRLDASPSANSPMASTTTPAASARRSIRSAATRLSLSLPSVMTTSTLRSRVAWSRRYLPQIDASRIAVPPIGSPARCPPRAHARRRDRHVQPACRRNSPRTSLVRVGRPREASAAVSTFARGRRMLPLLSTTGPATRARRRAKRAIGCGSGRFRRRGRRSAAERRHQLAAAHSVTARAARRDASRPGRRAGLDGRRGWARAAAASSAAEPRHPVASSGPGASCSWIGRLGGNGDLAPAAEHVRIDGLRATPTTASPMPIGCDICAEARCRRRRGRGNRRRRGRRRCPTARRAAATSFASPSLSKWRPRPSRAARRPRQRRRDEPRLRVGHRRFPLLRRERRGVRARLDRVERGGAARAG